jgi:glycosyltransferase involved in cell wall biosynthesis
MKTPCAIFVANRGFALYNSRMPLMTRLLNSGWRVVIATANDTHAADIATRGIALEPVHFARRGLALASDLRSLFTLWRIYRRHRPTLIHHFHAKPMIFGTIAARLALGNQVRIVNTVTGLGQAFVQGGLVRTLAGLGYRANAALADATIFQNRDDHDLFVSQGWVRPDKARVIVSSGVDTDRFTMVPHADGLRIVMVARLLRQKGVKQFIEAAHTVKAWCPEARFQLAGEMEPDHPDGIPAKDISRAVDDHTIEFLGYLNNIGTTLSGSFLFVLPSYYREGVPRVVLEAAACGVPAIVADSPGTRESVIDGETGFLVPPRDSAALAEKITALIRAPKTRDKMGLAARARVEEELNLATITEHQFAVYKELTNTLP